MFFSQQRDDAIGFAELLSAKDDGLIAVELGLRRSHGIKVYAAHQNAGYLRRLQPYKMK